MVDGTRYFNGRRLGKMTAIVRDIYFEPLRGHTADGAFQGVLARTRLGRPALLETHRENFIGTPQERSAALGELRRLLEAIAADLPETRFLSTEELADAYDRMERLRNS